MCKNRLLKILVALVIFAMISACYSKDPYMRINGDNFEIVKKTFVSPGGVKVALLGVIHIGDKEYYQKIQSILDDADLVLYELIGSKENMNALREEVARNCPRHSKKFTNNRSIAYADLAEAMGLSPQMGVIDYQRKHFINADMDYLSFLQKSTGKNKSICEFLDLKDYVSAIETDDALNSLEKMEKNSVGSAKNLLVFLQLKTIESTRAEPSGKDKLILFDRNDIVIEVLKEHLPNYKSGQEIIIFYGAAHLADLEASLLSMNFKKSDLAWLSAIKL